MQEPWWRGETGTPLPCDQREGKSVVQMKSVLDLAEERCEGVGVPDRFCFLNDEGGKTIS